MSHSRAYRTRRFLNWFPLGLTYALLYMGRYNLTVAKTSLGELMTKEDFGVIFGTGTLVYALAFLINGPLVDRMGGRRGALAAAAGATVANAAMGGYLYFVMSRGLAGEAPLRTVLSALYALNMYFQSFGAVSIVKVNAHWFHVNERGGFSGIFGTMISSGIFLAFTVNFWLLDFAEHTWPGTAMQWIVFAVPAGLLATMFVVELFLLQDRPSRAGHEDFDTGDASSGDMSEEPVPTLELLKRILTNPIILTVALIEFCTGVLRNGVMQWFPIYAKEVWALPSDHLLRNGSWEHVGLVVACFVVAAISGLLAARAVGGRRGLFAVLGALAFLAPFIQGGWGGLLFVAGVIGGNVAGWFSDLFFQSRRGPAAGGLYFVLALCTVGMAFTLAPSTNVVEVAKKGSGLAPGDKIVAIAGKDGIEGWSDVRDAVVCWQPVCKGSTWDSEACMCSTKAGLPASAPPKTDGIPARIERGGSVQDVLLPDPAAEQRAGDTRLLAARPVLPLTPYAFGVFLFLVSLCVIGTHGLLSGTATMDFGGRKGAATAVGVIDGFVYLGTALQAVALGFLTTESWSYWPPFLIPFAIIGFLFALRIWRAKPAGARA